MSAARVREGIGVGEQILSRARGVVINGFRGGGVIRCWLDAMSGYHGQGSDFKMLLLLLLRDT